jgi:hypothetical protein
LDLAMPVIVAISWQFSKVKGGAPLIIDWED